MAKHFVKREGEFDVQAFGIADSPEAFKILSDALYSNKIRAVIRELSTNAVDSHKVSGVKGPFQVHLPSYEEPWFCVRDYGDGMSHEDVMHLYVTYFGTNKKDDGKTTGCLGLGSKSPLSKVRSFTVISRHEGMERHYIVALNEEGVPEVNYLRGQDKKTIKSGMEIKLTVNSTDIREYSNQAAQVYFYFAEEDSPRIINGTNYVRVKKEVLIEGEGWKVYGGQGEPTAVQGNVGYPINSSNLKNVQPHHDTMLSCNLRIDFPLDSVAFTPSREHLSYKKSTCKAIETRLDEIVAEVNKTIIKKFDTCKTLWEARVLAYSMFWSSDANLGKLRQLADTGKITWQGQKIAGQQLNFSNIPDVEGWSFAIKRKSRGYWTSDYATSVHRRERSDYTPRKDAVWFEIDIPRGSISRCQQYIRENEEKTIYLVNFSTPEARQAFCDKMGLAGDEFVLTSTLPKPVRVQTTGKIHRATSMVYEHTGKTDARRLYEYWKEAEVDLDDDDGGVYVEMNRNKCLDTKGFARNPSEVGYFITLVNAISKDKLTVIGVRPQIAKNFRKSDDWVDIWTYAKKLVQIEVVQKKLSQHIVNAEALCNMDDVKIWRSLHKGSDKLGDVNEHGTMWKLLESLRHLKMSEDACPKYGDWRELASRCGIKIDAKPERMPNADVDNMYKVYPLIHRMVKTKNEGYYNNVCFYQEDLQAMGHYISLVEGVDKSKI